MASPDTKRETVGQSNNASGGVLPEVTTGGGGLSPRTATLASIVRSLVIQAMRTAIPFDGALETGHLYSFVIREVERPLLEEVLCHTKGNQKEAARILGINRNTLRTKIQSLKIDFPK